MDLVVNKPNVYVIEGNCEAVVEALVNKNPALINYLCTRKNTIFNEWLAQLNITVNEESDICEVKKKTLS